MINRKLVETPVRMMNRMEEITDLICEYNEEVQKQQQEIERLQKIINKAINRISLIRMDRDTSIETHKALDEILNILKGSDKE